jgi:hypothetical protein
MLVAQAALSGFEHRIRTPGAVFLGVIASLLRASRGSGGLAATNLRQRMSLRGRVLRWMRILCLLFQPTTGNSGSRKEALIASLARKQGEAK